jgi:hypothetical protein
VERECIGSNLLPLCLLLLLPLLWSYKEGLIVGSLMQVVQNGSAKRQKNGGNAAGEEVREKTKEGGGGHFNVHSYIVCVLQWCAAVVVLVE